MNQTFDANSMRTKLAVTVGSTADFVNDYTLDHLSRVTGIQQHGVTGGNSVADKRIDLAYNAAGQFDTIKRYADLAASKLVVTSAYSYDGLGRLTDLAHTKGTNTLAGYHWTF